MNCFWPQAVLYEMNVRQLTPEGTLRAATSKLPFLQRPRRRRRVAHAGLSDRGGRAQRLARLLLFDPRLLRREPRAGHDGRLRRLRRRGPPPRHAGPARLGGQPHGARRAVDRRKARLVVRTRRRGPSRRAVGLVRHRQTQLRRPRRVARAGRRHGVLAHAARRRRIPLRHGDAGSHRVLERDLAAPAACEARSVHAGRGRGAESFRGGGFRRLLRLADAPPDERRGPAAHPRHGSARLHLRRPRRLSRTRPCGWRSRRTTTRIRGTAPNFPDWATPARSWRSSRSSCRAACR